MIPNPDEFQVIDGPTIAEMACAAVQAERKRVHLLLHAGHDDQVQRLIVVMQPGTYRPRSRRSLPGYGTDTG